MFSVSCPFCNIQVTEVIEKYDQVYVRADKYPVSKGHLLIIPFRHIPHFFFLNEEERNDTMVMLKTHSEKIMKEDPTVTGFNIGWNCGESAGQTVPHCHCHLIPRRDGDTENPRGGVRGCIPSKMIY